MTAGQLEHVHSTVGANYRSNKVSLECLKLLGTTAGQLQNTVLKDPTIKATRSALNVSSCQAWQLDSWSMQYRRTKLSQQQGLPEVPQAARRESWTAVL
jgi:hypothetical protein